MCFGKCIRGREGQCCFGCSTRLGINLIGLICLFEVGLMGYLLAQGTNLQTIAWFAISFFRVLAYFAMCCDGISKRRWFMVTMILTTILEAVILTIFNVSIFGENRPEVIFQAANDLGWSTQAQIAIVEVASIANLALFGYFCAISYEYY